MSPGTGFRCGIRANAANSFTSRLRSSTSPIIVRVHSSTSARFDSGARAELAAQAFGRKLDRSQRIFDLVRDAPRHFAPRFHPLDLRNLADVLEEQHRAGGFPGVVAERTRRHHQFGFGAGDLQLDGRARFARTRREREHIVELARQRGRESSLVVAAEQSAALRPSSRSAQGLIAVTTPSWSRPTTPAETLRSRVSVYWRRRSSSAASAQIGRHLVERVDQLADLVVADRRECRKLRLPPATAWVPRASSLIGPVIPRAR